MSGASTLPPSRRKLRKAREEGDVARAPALTGAVCITVGYACVCYTSWPCGLMRELGEKFFAASADFQTNTMLVYLRATAGALLYLIAPFLLLLAGAAWAGEVGQVGLTFTSKTLEMKFSRLEISRGLKRILGIRENQQMLCWDLPREVLKALVCTLVLGGLTGIFLLSFSNYALITPAEDARELARLLLAAGRTLPGALLGWMWCLGAMDLISARRRRLERLKMNVEEFTRELRESEGNPETRSLRRHLHQELLLQGVLQGLRRARVLVVGSSARDRQSSRSL